MGPDVSVLDMSDVDCVTVATFDTKDFKLMPPEITLDAIDAKITTAVDAAVAKITTGMDAAIAKSVTDAMDAAKKAAPKGKVDANGDPIDDVNSGDKAINTGMDAKEVVATVDAAIEKATAPLLAKIATLEANNDGKRLMTEISQRDALAHKLAPHIGTFDHSEMTLGEVAVYGAEKLKLEAKGAEIVAVNAFLHARQPMTRIAATGQDGKEKVSSVDSYLTGAKGAAA